MSFYIYLVVSDTFSIHIYNLIKERAQICKRLNHDCGSWVVLGYGLFGSHGIPIQKVFGCGKRFLSISLENSIAPHFILLLYFIILTSTLQL